MWFRSCLRFSFWRLTFENKLTRTPGAHQNRTFSGLCELSRAILAPYLDCRNEEPFAPRRGCRTGRSRAAWLPSIAPRIAGDRCPLRSRFKQQRNVAGNRDRAVSERTQHLDTARGSGVDQAQSGGDENARKAHIRFGMELRDAVVRLGGFCKHSQHLPKRQSRWRRKQLIHCQMVSLSSAGALQTLTASPQRPRVSGR